MRYVIIGNSAAAIGGVEGIRQYDQSGEILLLTREAYHTYSRPLISYLIAGKTDMERMRYRPNDFYEEHNCTLRTAAQVRRIDPAAHTVLLADGEAVGYDKLLVAAGASPLIPAFEGLDTVKNRCAFQSLDDAKRLRSMLTPESRVLIAGAGLIGLKCAEGIQGLVREITVADIADRVLPSVLDESAARLVQEHMERNGIRFLLSDGVARFDNNVGVLASSMRVPFDVLVVAVGVRPNTELIADAGGRVEKGIVTDWYCRTTLPDIYAAGDCTQSLDVTTGAQKVMALLPNAYMQGECAGINMAGGEKLYNHAVPMNAVGFFGLHVLSAGTYDGDSFVSHARGSYKHLVVRDNRLKGFMLVGDVARAGIYTQLIREQTPLDTIDFDLIREKPQLMAFSRASRMEMLGGAGT